MVGKVIVRLRSTTMNRKSSLTLAAAALVAGLGSLIPAPAVANTAPAPTVSQAIAAARQAVKNAATTRPARTATAAESRAAGLRFFDLPTRDGLKLKANVVEPRTTGRHPAIVLPASWAANDFEYLLQAGKLAERGYVVLSFTPRGLFGSGGEIDVAGPKDLSDISAAFDWLVANTSADPERLGVAGVSYGGDMALQMPGVDRRAKAVAGLSAYASLPDSLYPDKTRVSLTVPMLWAVGKVLGRPSAEFTEMMNTFQQVEHENDPRLAKILAWAGERSAAAKIEAINRTKPAVFLANGWGDSFFPPNQYVDFFNRLTVPNKHLEFAPGDHATSEGIGLAGLPNPVWDGFGRFFDKHLAGRTDVKQDAPVVLTARVNKPGPQNVLVPGPRESYPDWASVAKETETYGLGADERLTAGGGEDPRRTIRSGTDTAADSGFHFLSNAVDQFLGTPPTVNLRDIGRKDGAVWQTAPLGRERKLRGEARLKATVTTSAPTNTFIAYLYDVDSTGKGRLLTHAPYTLRDVTPGTPIPVSLRLHGTAYDVPAGHRLALAIDTKDFRYMDGGKPGGSLTFTGPATLDVPLR